MNKVKSFEDLDVWRRSMMLFENYNRIWKNNRNFELKNQLFRAALSVPANIAEGFERYSAKEYVRFLFIAKASCGEVRTILYVAIKLYPDFKPEFKDQIEECKIISRMLMKMISSISKRNNLTLYD